jgi:hypothetical protein
MICRPKRQLAMPKRASMRTQSLCWQATGRDVSKAKASRHKAKGIEGSEQRRGPHGVGRSDLQVPSPGPTPEGKRMHRQIPGQTVFPGSGFWAASAAGCALNMRNTAAVDCRKLFPTDAGASNGMFGRAHRHTAAQGRLLAADRTGPAAAASLLAVWLKTESPNPYFSWRA